MDFVLSMFYSGFKSNSRCNDDDFGSEALDIGTCAEILPSYLKKIRPTIIEER